ncbi:ribosomal protein L5 [Sporormia fimetaria CBS 119925]|uniref:Ribosomal protein L5 n=1 Tax=Sporormia fimetaria CBS 119925 TaxID=1340428 RepID=A0A6A6VI61_9PLEO|nr:ribosomal protein L5 [Sporormia fimetaria CBS 119925]
MALRELPLRTAALTARDVRPVLNAVRPHSLRNASSAAAPAEVEPSSFEVPPPPPEAAQKFDPIARSKARQLKKNPLPPSRYQYRPPKYYRGPLHPHQPPPVSDPASRLFQPGPFSLPRLEQTYQSTIAADLLTLTYQHRPPGYRAPVVEQRLREWTGESPYFKNRPLRPPRGGSALRLLTPHRDFRNIPEIKKVVVHTMVPEAQEDSAHLHVAGMVVQAMTNVRVVAHRARSHVVQWGLKKDKYVAVTADVEREDTFHFLSKLIDVVLPKIKEWKGVAGTSGDGSGNISFGLTADQVAMFPEIEVNYDSYPPKMIPGCHITIHTSATNDQDAYLLLQSIGIPFYGKLKG